MSNWKNIKEKILFSYQEVDWISIQILKADIPSIHRFLEKRFELTKNDGLIYSFKISEIETYFYLESDQVFDFDPKEINSEKQWKQFLDLFISMSKELGIEILFKPEDSMPDDTNLLVEIRGDSIKYDFQVYKNYLD